MRTDNGFGGKPEPGDKDLLASAVRELYEESGLLVTDHESMKTRGVLFLHPGGQSEIQGLEIWVYTVSIENCTGEIAEWVPRHGWRAWS
jgi:8-oxo-dGTP pyrophosphatase MutT (NUDIX family)